MSSKLFAPLLKNLFKGEEIDAPAFWTALEEENFEEHAAQFSLMMFENLCMPKKSKFVTEKEENIYATLLAIEYYKNRKPKSVAVINSCKKFMQKGIGHTKWILDLFSSSLKDSYFAQYFMSRLVIAPKQIDQNINIVVQLQKQQGQINQCVRKRKQISLINEIPYERIKSLSYPLQVCPQTKVISFSYVCFLDYVRSNNNQLKFQQYRHILTIFKTLYHNIKVNNDAFYYMCIFQHLIINCITFYSCPYENILKQLILCANHLKNCYGMVGELGNQLFELLVKELKIPGHAFRKKLRHDFPSLDIKQSSFLNREFYFVTENEDCFTCPQDRSLSNLRKLIIWHVLKIASVQDQQLDLFMQMLRLLPHDATYQLYFKTLRIVDVAQQLEVFDKIKTAIRQHMISLYKETKKKFQFDSKRAPQMEVEEFDSLTQEENALNVFRYPTFEIVYVPLKEFMNIKSKINLFSIVKRMRNQNWNMTFYRNSISIIFYGTSNDFVSLVQVLSRFMEEADISQYRQLEIYYLPKYEVGFGQEIASYIASKDIWYRRFVYNIFKQKLIFPHLSAKSANKKLFPIYIMNKTIHMYLREAKRIFHLKVYRCILRSLDSQQPIVVYFTSSVMVGIFAQAEMIRLSKENKKDRKQKYEGRDPILIIRQKLQKHICLSADIQIRQQEPETNIVHKIVEKNLKFQDIQICNMPKPYFFGGKPDPSGNGLRLSILTQANSKIFWKQFYNYENFRENKNSQQINLAFKDIFINYTIKSLIMKPSMPDTSFKVLVDRVPYNKVLQIQIESPVTVNGFPLAIPIYTFLPFK